MKYKYCVFIAIIVILGCQKDNSDVIVHLESDFPTVKQLSEQNLVTKEILNVRNFFIKDSLIVVKNSREDSLFMIFNTNTLKCIKSWGNRGDGPNEYSVFTHILDINKDELQVLDFNKYKLQSFKTPNFRGSDIQEITSGNNQDGSRLVPQNIVAINNSQYLFNVITQNGMCLSKFSNGSEPVEILNFNEFEGLHNDPTVYQGVIGINKKRDRIVYANRYMRQFYLINSNGKVLKNIKTQPSVEMPDTQGGRLNMRYSKICYTQVRASDDSFYLHYVGLTPAEIEENNFMAQSFIEEYDWEGNPLCRYTINRYLHNFDIIECNDNNKSFIGIVLNNNNPFIKLDVNNEN